MTVVTQDAQDTLKTVESKPAAGAKSTQILRPWTDIYETTTAVVVEADVPGLAEADVDITLEKDVLTIAGTIDDGTRQYRRRFALSEKVAQDEIEAVLQHGVLQVKLPKVEQALARKIEIKKAS